MTAGNIQRAVVVGYDPLNDAETDAGSLVLGGEKRIQNLVSDIIRNPRTRIGNADRDPVSFKLRVYCYLSFAFDQFCGLGSIGNEVENHLFNQVWIRYGSEGGQQPAIFPV